MTKRYYIDIRRIEKDCLADVFREFTKKHNMYTPVDESQFLDYVRYNPSTILYVRIYSADNDFDRVFYSDIRGKDLSRRGFEDVTDEYANGGSVKSIVYNIIKNVYK